MITRGVSREAGEQIVLKVNALAISGKPLHPSQDSIVRSGSSPAA
jgi:hypothetical protein